MEDLSFVEILPLADSRFSYSKKIYGIMGAKTSVEILKGDKIIDRSYTSVSLNTSFGYVISGKFPSCNSANLQRNSNSFYVVLDNFALEKLLKNFMKLEEVQEKAHFRCCDSACEDSFEALL